MAKHKKKKHHKPSRRERQTSGAGKPQVMAAKTEPTPTAETSAETVNEPIAAPEPDAEPTPPAVTFTPSHQADATIAREQRHISHDLRQLGIQLGVVTVVIAGLGILDAQTDAIRNLGNSLFSLWQ